MKKFNLTTFLFLITLSSHSFACRPASALVGSTWQVNGVISKLVKLEKYRNYQLKDLMRNKKDNSFIVILANGEKDCVRLNMSSTSDGMCKYSAEVLSARSVACH